MNMTTATCGHYIPAIGSPNSIARKRAESLPCHMCLVPEMVKAMRFLASNVCAPLGEGRKAFFDQYDNALRLLEMAEST